MRKRESLATKPERWYHSTALRAIAKLTSGQTLASALPLAAAPLLGRLYLPTDYGALAAYMALSGLFGAFSTLQLHQGIIAERSERNADDLVLIVLCIAGVVACLAIMVALSIYSGLAGNDEYQDLRAWLLLLPFTVMSGGATAGIAALANRREAYGALARLPVVSAVATVATSILFGYWRLGANGLMISYFLGQVIALIAHLGLYRKLVPHRSPFHRRRFLALAWRHRDYARYSLPSQFLGLVSQDMPVYAITASSSMGLLGEFNRARSLVLMPLALVGMSVAQVFRQRAAEDYNRTGSCRPLYIRTGLALIMAGVIPTLVLTLWAPDLFRMILGPNWLKAGEIVRFLAPMLLVRLVASPLSVVFLVVGRQKLHFFLTALTLVLSFAATFGFFWYDTSHPMVIVVGFSIAYALAYAIFIFVGFLISAR